MAEHSLDNVTLPGLVWTDEYSWNPVAQTEDYSLTGALIVQTGTRQAGRPITLQGGDDYGWITKSTLEQLRGMLNTSTHALTLADGQTCTVRWRGDEPIQSEPLLTKKAPDSGDYYHNVTLRLMGV